jgi:hypothetical protein
MIDVQSIVHYSLHLIFPFLLAWFLFRKNWKIAGFIMFLTLLVDLDHLFANPLFDPQRCSIGFHPLHSFPAIGIYTLMVFIPKVRIPAVGLLFHMFTDLIDCFWTFSKCHDCYLNSKIHQIIAIFCG